MTWQRIVRRRSNFPFYWRKCLRLHVKMRQAVANGGSMLAALSFSRFDGSDAKGAIRTTGLSRASQREK
jgi:hypothetical protein